MPGDSLMNSAVGEDFLDAESIKQCCAKAIEHRCASLHASKSNHDYPSRTSPSLIEPSICKNRCTRIGTQIQLLASYVACHILSAAPIGRLLSFPAEKPQNSKLSPDPFSTRRPSPS